MLPHRAALGTDLRLALLIYLHVVARGSDESQSIERYTGEMIGLLEVCSNKLLHAWAWHMAASECVDLSEASAAWERSIACARAARVEPGLGPEFGVVSDRDFTLGNPLRWYADRLTWYGEYARAAPLLMESAQIFQARGSRYLMADILGTAGRMALLQGDLTKAHTLLHESVTLAKELQLSGNGGQMAAVPGTRHPVRGRCSRSAPSIGGQPARLSRAE